MTEASHAVFLSYASQDAPAAHKICEALRAAGIEVWFDQSELRGGEVWDQTIRKQIKACTLFIPIISRHTHERKEGYFRLEWKLAVDRSNLISATQTFLLPVVIDDTREDDEEVPEKFRDIHWTRLPAGETPPAFIERVRHLLSSDLARQPANAQSGAVGLVRAPVQSNWSPKRGLLLAIGLVIVAVIAYFSIEKPWISKPSVSTPTVAASAASAAFNPPPHSIAVLPFVNMSGEKEQEYFSDGLSEELLNDLARINELQVCARTSAFSFKGKDTDIGTIARKLNVGSVLEGSVRRSGTKVRITAQLINAVTGFHIWSQTYDRNVGDVLALQTEIATSVANSLKVTLLEDTGKRIELGGTANPAAFDAYLRGKKLARTADTDEDVKASIAAFTEAIQLDSRFAKAFAERALQLSDYARFNARGPEVRASHNKALADAQTAVSLAPELAEGHFALAAVLESGSLKFAEAQQEYERAATLAPGNARILSAYSRNAADLGHIAAATSAARQAIALDPLSFHAHRVAGIVFLLTRQYTDAIAALRTAISLQPDFVKNHALLGSAQYYVGDLDGARESCEVARDDEMGQGCLAIVYQKLGREADAEAMLQKVISSLGDTGAYEIAGIYAQRGDIPRALQWLETAVHQRDSGLFELKVDPDLDPLRNEPRFQAVLRALKFPD